MRESEMVQKLRRYWIKDIRAIAGGASTTASTVVPDAMEAHELANASSLGPYHTVSGLTAGQVLKAAGSTSAYFASMTHGELGGVSANQHHNQVHDILGTDHTVTGGANLDVIGQSGAGTIARLTPSSDVSAGASALLKSNAGALTVATLTAGTKMVTPEVETATGDLTLDPTSGIVVVDNNLRVPTISTSASDLSLSPSTNITSGHTIRATNNLQSPLVQNTGGSLDFDSSSDAIRILSSNTIKTDNYASQTTGWGVSYAGGADFRYLFADEVHAKSFIADLEQALAGGQIISKSVAVVYADFTLPATGSSATFVVRDLPSATGMAVFQNSDYVRFRKFTRAAGSLTVADAWGTVTLDTTYGTSGFDAATKTQRYTFARTAGAQGGTATGTIAADALVLDYGVENNGLYEVNAIDGAYAINSPYLQFVTWTSHPQSGQLTRLRLGNLRGLTAQANEYGLFAGDGTTDADNYIRVSSYTNRFNNVPSTWYSSGVKVIGIDKTNGISIQQNSGFVDNRAFKFEDAGTVLGGLYGDGAAAGNASLSVQTRSLSSGDATVYVRAYGGAGSTDQGTIHMLARGEGRTANFWIKSTRSGVESSEILLDANYIDVSGVLEVETINEATGVNIQYNGATKLATTTGGVTVTGTTTTGTINAASGVSVQYNGSTKVATTTGGITVTGTTTTSTVNGATGIALQYNGSTKMDIVSGGADVTGSITSTTGSILDGVRIGVTSYGGISIVAPSSSWARGMRWLDQSLNIEAILGAYGDLDTISYMFAGAAYNDTVWRLYPVTKRLAIGPNAGEDANATVYVAPNTGESALKLGRATNQPSVEGSAILIADDGAGASDYVSINHYSGNKVVLGYGGGAVGVGSAALTPATRLDVDGSVTVRGDQTGPASAVTFTNVTSGVSSGTGTVKMGGTGSGNSTGWLKIYVGGSARYIPFWSTTTP